jgi:hypothetical protein
VKNIAKWLDRFLNEKEIDLERVVEVAGPSGPNFIPLAIVVDAIKRSPGQHQEAIHKNLVRLDFFNRDVVDYFRHLAQALAI